MKRLFAPLLLILFAVIPVRAQDTLGASHRPSLCAPITGTALITTGSAFTFVPAMKNVAIDLRDAVQADGHAKVTYDNYLQYLPAAVPPVLSVCGLESEHNFKQLAILEGGSFLLGAAVLNGVKWVSDVQRPDLTAHNSFPSGHTFTAFVGAEVLRQEYGTDYPWIAVAGYAVATLVGATRIYNNRHWLGDVLAGAGLGILSVDLTYWLYDKTNKKR